jgi:putative photosynthetic complex assembly protein
MTAPTSGYHVPRFVLIGAALLIVATITAALAMRVIGIDRFPPTAAVLAERELRFTDRADGAITVTNAADGTVIDILAPGSNAFIRGTLRGLARQRRSEDVGKELPFRLTAYADGRLTLDDPGTGRRIDLEAFGPTNVQAFARFLPIRSATP